LPEEFKNSISPDILKYITIAGGISILALQFFKTKDTK
jgi:hypothetical protein